MHDKLKKVIEQREGEKIALAKAQQESSRNRLRNILKKKLTTTFIGSLVQFETYFGSLWGHGKPLEELTEDQQGFRALWEQCRTEILNNGNHQIHAVEKEISQYDMSWKMHQITLHTKN